MMVMMMMQVVMFSGGQFREGLEGGCSVQCTATGSGRIYVLSFHPGRRMRMLGGHDGRVGRQGLRVRRSSRGRRVGCVVKEGRVTSWCVWGCLLVAVCNNAETLASVTFRGRSHLQQGIGGSLTL